MTRIPPKNQLTIPGVRLEKLIGQGGMGSVFLATQTYLNRKVAVKLIKPDGFADEEEKAQRFKREAHLLAGLAEPHIVACYDGGVTAEGYYFLVMEYIEGPNLAQYVRERGPLDEETALKIVLAVSEALSHAWNKGVIHRDVKAENILLQPQSNKPLTKTFPYGVKLADLGLAKYQSQNDVQEQVTRRGVIMGTPAVMAPEQFQDADPIDYRVDIYALGCLLFHCLRGKSPFDGFSLSRIVAKKIAGESPDIEPIVGRCKPETATFIQHLMAFQARERPQTYEEVVAWCKAALHDPNGATGPREPQRRRAQNESSAPSIYDQVTVGVRSQTREPRFQGSRRRWGVILSAITLLGSLIVLTWVFSGQKPSADVREADHPTAALGHVVSSSVPLELSQAGAPLFGPDYPTRIQGWEKEGTWGPDEDGHGVVVISGEGPSLLIHPGSIIHGRWIVNARFQNAFELGAGILIAEDHALVLRVQNLGDQILYSAAKIEGLAGQRSIRPIPEQPVEALALDPTTPLTLIIERQGTAVRFTLNQLSLGFITVNQPGLGFCLFAERGAAVFEDLEVFLPTTQ